MKTFLIFLTAGLLVLTSVAQQKPADAAAATPTSKTTNEFRFDGGNLKDFLNAIKSEFAVDLEKIGTVPEAMLYSVRVPKMRLARGGQMDFRNVLNLYNQVSDEGDPSLGRWVIKGPLDRDPELIMLVARGPRGDGSFSIRAFSMPNEQNPDWGKMLDLVRNMIESQQHRILEMVEIGRHPGVTPSDLNGDMHYHNHAGILVVSGGKVYVEMATAIIEAMKEKTRMSDIRIPQAPAPKAEDNPK